MTKFSIRYGNPGKYGQNFSSLKEITIVEGKNEVDAVNNFRSTRPAFQKGGKYAKVTLYAVILD